ncbi:RNA polymerase sigma factor [Catenuloplanes japonicus]|uniref:RNA polymerase sigma factor n=1 Tax=Catenuloplanes japonicus TaxID=33876 RepID=UPI000524DC7C|nr:sigma-70 family RNA polymerase sigma factor [Catenuloplanes japonicus]
MGSADEVVAAVWREQSARLVGGLLRLTRDADLAQDLAHDAMVAALEQWPSAGVPENPAAWLMAVARRRAVDHFRRAERHERAETRIAHELRTASREEEQMPEVDTVDDDTLRLMLLTCHPALTTESQVALTLRLVGGLTSREIARAFLVPEDTVARRITRARTTLAWVARTTTADDGEPFDLPGPAARRQRLPTVMNVVYLVFTEGYAATAGEDWMRPALCDEAIRLGRLVTTLFPDEPEASGLLALMWLQSSRAGARTDGDGAAVLLEQQDRGRFDRDAIRRGTEALGRALSAGPPGPYTLQAAIAACHARAASVRDTDWATIAGLYDALAHLTASPIVLLNRAVAHGMHAGPDVGLRLADELAALPGLRGHHHLPSVRAELLSRLGRHAEARREFRHAAGLATNARERDLLLGRAEQL